MRKLPGQLAGCCLLLAYVSNAAAQQHAAVQTAQKQYPDAFNIKDFGAVGDGNTLNTLAISRAVQAAHSSGGGRVVVPPGIYVTGTFELLDNVTLDVEAGAVIRGSKNISDYKSIAEFGFAHQYGLNSTGEGDLVGVIVVKNAENVAIIGQGTIDGDGDSFFDFNKPHYGMDFDPQYTRQGKDFVRSMQDPTDGPVEAKPSGRPGTMIVFWHCRNILIRDITLKNAPNWTFHLLTSSAATITGIHIVNNPLLPNNDGIDCIGCKDVHISDCDIHAGDDDFAFWGSEDVSVVGCSLYSRSSGIRLEDSRYATFSDLSIHSNRGIGIYEREGQTHHLLFTHIVFQTQLLAGHWWGKGEPIFVAIGPPRGSGKAGGVHDVRFSDISGEAEAGIILNGDAASRIHNLFLDRINLRIRPPRKNVSDEAGGNFDFRWIATDMANAVFKHDIPALYAHNVDGLYLRDFHLEWSDGLPGYFSSAMECEDFKELHIDGFSGRQASPDSANPVIALRRGNGVSITNSSAATGATTFVSMSDVSGEGLFSQNDLQNAKHAFRPEKNGFITFGNALPH
jgi:hypothetical protein